ncbi:MAG: ribonucleotide-diphosphate reductase subunit alpha, partial [Candidatus Calescibacterium sp.]|nr:ribonucleotide-diphosphate reductase subunit alpha [Candidatus Calescibacterium sp.]
ENKKEEKTKFIRPKKLFGETVKMKMGDDVLYVTINKDEENKIREVFVNMGKSGGRDKAVTEALGRIISIYLQEGGDIMEVVKQLREIKADEIYWDNKIPIHSIPDAIAKAISLTLNDSIEHHSLSAKTQKENNPRMEICKSCGEKTLVNENGCWTCRNCGYSKCQ